MMIGDWDVVRGASGDLYTTGTTPLLLAQHEARVVSWPGMNEEAIASHEITSRTYTCSYLIVGTVCTYAGLIRGWASNEGVSLAIADVPGTVQYVHVM